MTKKEGYLKALRNEASDCLIRTPNIDYWLQVNSVEGTVPEKLQGMSRNDIVREVGGTIWARASVLREEYDERVKITVSEHKGELGTRFETSKT